MFSPLPLSLISLHLSHTHRRRVLLELEDQAPDERAAIGVRELDLGDVPSLSPTPLPHPPRSLSSGRLVRCFCLVFAN